MSKEAPTADPLVCNGVVPNDGRVYRHFPLLTGGEDKALDALNIAYMALKEIEDGGDLEANLRWLIAKFSINIGHQIRQGGRYGCTHCD